MSILRTCLTLRACAMPLRLPIGRGLCKNLTGLAIRALPLAVAHPVRAPISIRTICTANRPKAGAKNLQDINDLFLRSYAVRKENIKRAQGITAPVILINGDDLILRHQGKRTAIKYVPEHYHNLKSIAHIACLIHTVVRLGEKKLVVDAEIARTNGLKALDKILLNLKTKKAPSGIKKYEPLLLQYRQMLQKGCSISDLASLDQSLKQLIDEAAKCRIDALHQVVGKIRKDLGEKPWDLLSVLVMGPPMPREGELSMQYFKATLSSDKKKCPHSSTSTASSDKEKCPHATQSLTNYAHLFNQRRLIYAESIYDEDKALDLLTTHICDEDLGEDLLGEKEVMRADFLKDSAQKHLIAMGLAKPKQSH